MTKKQLAKIAYNYLNGKQLSDQESEQLSEMDEDEIRAILYQSKACPCGKPKRLQHFLCASCQKELQEAWNIKNTKTPRDETRKC